MRFKYHKKNLKISHVLRFDGRRVLITFRNLGDRKFRPRSNHPRARSPVRRSWKRWRKLS